MGCIHSSTNDSNLLLSNSNIVDQNFPSSSSSSSLTIVEQIEVEKILSAIPQHCRQTIANFPSRQLLNIYQRHFLAKYYIGQENFVCAIAHEYRVAKELEVLMGNDEDHFIYIDIYNVMSKCLMKHNAIPTATQLSRSAMALLLKHTPMDQAAISTQYANLAVIYQVQKDWANANYCLKEAINTAQKIDQPDHQYIQLLQKNLDLIKEQVVDEIFSTMTLTKVEQKPGETEDQCRRRAMAEIIEFNAEHGTFPFDKFEFTRLPLKETESLVNDQILNDVILKLKTFLTKSPSSESEEFNFIAVEFKHAQMKETSLSPAIIEAALTIIFDQINNEKFSNDEKYASLKQFPYSFSYTHDHFFHQLGVRVFLVKTKSKLSQK
ncbi:unnamed protein product [Rotaria socialis]|uniref:Uncharacterized protein n=1 Tax=Rotaria socialis TaxID=392032 RepID=A0A821HCP6_9BILA|nr:unnamed protein product [Rotaria socialis]CAF3532619.1 unnamed protein product [Rotaria socialis]CAF3786398.1 unnamed protein product [Rotaria socialis]CAF4469312.1 unnamed protein product [Rotaria socialis]CAF4683035.1 unnamed protein product [Rotaria socialis]